MVKEVKNIMKGIKITLVLLIICQAVIAQQKTAEEITSKRLEKIKSALELTTEQRANIEAILATSSNKLIALRESAEFNREEAMLVKKEERKLIKEELTIEQRTALKEANVGKKAERKEAKAQRAETKEALGLKRASFDATLSGDEKMVIEQARSLVLKKLSKDARTNLSEEEKANRKATKKEIASLLKPVIENHKTELDAIRAEMPEKPKKMSHSSDKKVKVNQRFYRKFLLMK